MRPMSAIRPSAFATPTSASAHLELLEPRRLCAAGDQDLSYGDNGFLQLQFGPAEYQFLPGSDPTASATVIAMSADGKRFSVQKFNAGVPDTTAGANGIIASNTLPFTQTNGQRVRPRRIWNLSGGRTLVEFVDVSSEAAFNGYFVRLKSDKTVDTSYGAAGSVFFLGGFPLEAVQQGDKLVVISGGYPGSTVERYTEKGKPDYSFGTAGVVNIERYPRNLLLQQDGNTLVSSSYGSTPKVYRLTVDGQLDKTFGGGDGIAVGGYVDALRAMAFDSQGRIVLSGTAGVTRLSSDGLLDTSFGTNGVTVAPQIFESPNDLATDGEAVLSDGTTLAAYGGRRFIRIDANGNYDTAFGRVDVQLGNLAPGRESDLLFPIFFDMQTADAQPDGSVIVSRRYMDGRFIQLRIEGGGSTPGPITLTSGTLNVTGTSRRDVIEVPAQFLWTTALLNNVGRTYSLSDVKLLTANGGDGDDLIVIQPSGATYPSSLSGGEGNDKLLGGRGADSLSGNAGKDTLKGDEGNDRLSGNGGRDRLFGGDGDDRIFGGASGDWLYAELGNDQLNGEGGNDRLYADDSADTGLDLLHGNAGDDIFITTDTRADSLFGDGGSDSALTEILDTTESIETLL